MNYQDDIAIIGNADARLAELLHQAMKSPDGERLLFEAFWDPYPPLRHRAADELADLMSDSMALLVARVAAGDLDGLQLPLPVTIEVRRTAALAARTDSLPAGAQDFLLHAFADPDENLRYHVFLALHRNADRDTLHGLTERGLSDVDAGVVVIAAQVAAEYHFEDLISEVLLSFQRLDGTDRFAVAAALSELIKPEAAPAEVVEALLDGLRNERTIAAACQALARIRAQRAVAPLKRAMGSFLAHPLNKVEAAAALVALGDQDGATYLERMLTGRRKDTRGYAIELIATLGLEQYRPQIEAIARSSEYHADTAVMALANFGDSRALELLGQIARTHPDPEIRELAAETSAADGSVSSSS